jgi:hypothetical protein
LNTETWEPSWLCPETSTNSMFMNSASVQFVKHTVLLLSWLSALFLLSCSVQCGSPSPGCPAKQFCFGCLVLYEVQCHRTCKLRKKHKINVLPWQVYVFSWVFFGPFMIGTDIMSSQKVAKHLKKGPKFACSFACNSFLKIA